MSYAALLTFEDENLVIARLLSRDAHSVRAPIGYVVLTLLLTGRLAPPQVYVVSLAMLRLLSVTHRAASTCTTPASGHRRRLPGVAVQPERAAKQRQHDTDPLPLTTLRFQHSHGVPVYHHPALNGGAGPA